METGEKHALYIQRELSRYRLPSETLWEMRMVLERRYPVKFSETLSPEGRLAMKQVQEDEGKGPVITENDIRATPAPTKGIFAVSKQSTPRTAETPDDKRIRTISVTDKYKRSYNRLAGDVTNGNRIPDFNLAKKAMGGKSQSATELGTQGSSTPLPNVETEQAVTIHSMEKCRVWIEVNNDTEVNSSGQRPASMRQ